MTILIINSDAIYLKDSEHFIHKNTGDFLNNLVRVGLKVSIFHFSAPLQDSSISTFRLDENNIDIQDTPRTSSKIISYLKASYRLFKIFRKVDFVYCFYPNAFAYNLLLCKFLGKPFGLYLRGENKIQSKLSKYFYKNAEFITTISPLFTEIVKKYNTSTYTIAPMINYGVEDIIVQKAFSPKSKISILFIGRVERDKGIFELIEAINSLKIQGFTKLVVNIIGQGEDYNDITRLINRYEIQEYVKLIGIISDKKLIKQFYMDADLFILPTYHEGFPRVLYEAMIFKVPIITTFVGAIPSLMREKFNCFKIEKKSESSIVETLIPILLDYSITHEIANNATETITNYLKTNNSSHQKIIHSILKHYESKN